METSGVLLNRMPPKFEEVKIYFFQKGISEKEAEHFFLFYELKNWTSKKGNFFKNWKGIAYQWIAGVIKHQPQLFNRQIH